MNGNIAGELTGIGSRNGPIGRKKLFSNGFAEGSIIMFISRVRARGDSTGKFSDVSGSVPGHRNISRENREIKRFIPIHLNSGVLAIPAEVVREIYVPLYLKGYPGANAAVPGCIHIRGEVFPVVNPFYLSGGVEEIPPTRPKLLILGETYPAVSLLAERIGEIIEISVHELAGPSPDSCIRAHLPYGDRQVPALDIEILLRRSLSVFREVFRYLEKE